jgi:phage-related protein
MALVGEAHILVRAITTGVEKDIERGFGGTDRIAKGYGDKTSKSFNKAFSGNSAGIFSKLNRAFDAAAKRAEGTRAAWAKLQKTGFALQTVVGVAAGSIGALVGGLGALIGSAGAAATSGIALVGVFVSLKLASVAAKLALGGIGKALSAMFKQQEKGDKASKSAARQIEDARKNLAKVIASNAEALVEANERIRKAQEALNKAFEDGKEEVQQLGFAAEDAALSEKRAALDLEKARDTLARVQDLPPNSRARREAELAFAEAELNYRQAVDTNQDLAKEQQRINGDPKNTQGYIDAAESLAEAEKDKAKAVIDAIQSEIDARQRLKDAIEDAAASAKANDPLADLTKSQREFTLRIAALRPLLKQLKEDVASGFLPLLGDQIFRIVNSGALGIIRTGLKDMGVALGNASKNFTDQFLKSENLTSLAKVFETAAYVTEKFGTILGTVFGSLIKLLAAADPLTRRFTDFIEKKATAFDKFLSTKKASGELTEFFNRAGDIAADFGDIFGNIFGFMGNVVKANFGPGSGGDILLQYLKEATQGWNDFGKTPEGMATLQTYFKDAAENLKSMMSVLGPFVLEILKLGADKNIKVFWDTLGEGLPYLTEIMKSGIEAGPSLAELLVALTRITAVFTDSGAIQTFFGILSAVAEKVADFLENKTVRAVLDVISKFAAMFLAIGTIAAIAGKVGTILFATFARFGIVFGPILFLIAAIAGAMMFLYNTNADVKASLDAIGTEFMAAFAEIGKSFGAMMTEMGPTLVEFVKSLTDILMQLIPVIKDQIMPAFFKMLESILPLIPVIINGLLPAITAIVSIIVPLIANLLTGLMPAITSVVEIIAVLATAFGKIMTAMAPLINDIIAALIPAINRIIEAIVPVIQVLIENFVPIFNKIMQAILPLIPILINMLVPIIEQLMDAVVDILPIFMDLVSMFIDSLLPAVLVIFNAIMPLIQALIELLIPIIKTLLIALTPIIAVFMQIVAVVANLVAMFLSFLMPVLTVLIKIITFIVTLFAEGFSNAVKFFVSIFKGVFEGISGFFKGIINGLISAVEGFINFFINGLNWLIDMINKISFDVPDWVPFIGGKKFGFQLKHLATVKLARLADGGTVMPTPGGTLAQIAEAGRPERVEPLDPNGLSNRDKAMIEMLSGGQQGSPVNITVVATPEMDKSELAAEIGRVLQLQMRRGARG